MHILAPMPILTYRARLLALVTLLIAASALALFAWFVPRLEPTNPGTSLPGTLPIAAPGSEVLLAVGDIASCDFQADEVVADLASRIPGTIALIGDIAYERGEPEEFAECFDPAWGLMRPRIRPALGNHDVLTQGAAGYFDYFGQGVGEPGRGWYSYDLGAWHAVVLNSNCDVVGCGPGSPQVDWLRQDLATNPSDCLLAYWHHPRWSSGRRGSSTSVDVFWNVLADAGADVILNGHDHTYERLVQDGIRQFVVGTGGNLLYPFEKQPLPQTEIRQADAYGLLWLALGPGTYEWQYLALGNSGFTDAGSGDCN